MSAIADWITSWTPEQRIFNMRAHLLNEAAAGNGGRMGRLVIDPAWIEAQRSFDPSLQNYLEGVELAIHSIEAGQAGERGLLLLMVLSVLDTTVRSITARLPDEALQVMSQEGRIDDARAVAMQRSTPLERCMALLLVTQVESGLGNRNAAAETRTLARQEAQKIANPASRVSAMLSLLSEEQEFSSNRGQYEEQLAQLCDLAETVKEWRAKTYALAEIFSAANAAGIKRVSSRCASSIQKTYAAQKAAVEKDRAEKEKQIDRKSLMATLERMRLPTQDPLITMMDDLALWEQPGYLAAAAWADKLYAAQHKDSPYFSRGSIALVLAEILRAAARKGDRAVGERMFNRIQASYGTYGTYNWIYSDVWHGSEFIEAAAETGFRDAALKLIAQTLSDTPDVSAQRAALARGAGRHGDIEGIHLAARPIQAAGRPGSFRDRLDRTFEGVKESAAKTATAWFLAQGVSAREIDKLLVYVEGYQGLMDHDPRQAEAFRISTCKEFSPSGEKLFRQLLVVGSEALESKAYAWMEKLIRAVERLPWTNIQELASERVEYWLSQSNFEQALKVANEASSPAERPILLRLIAVAMIKAGQLDRALTLAATITDRIEQRGVFQVAMEHLIEAPDQHAGGWTNRVTAGLGKLTDDNRLAVSPAMPVLLAAYTTQNTVQDAWKLLGSLGQQALLAACEPLAAAATNSSMKQAVQAAQQIVDWLEKQKPSVERIRVACAVVRAWGANAQLAAHARRAYEMALKDARGMNFVSFDRFDSILQPAKQGPKTKSILAELAGAARALRDRQLLQDLFAQVKKTTQGMNGEEDLAFIEIAAGLAALGDFWRYKSLYDFPPYQALRVEHHAFAQVEIAIALRGISAEMVYKKRKRNTLSAAMEWAEDNISAKIDSESSDVPVGPWGSYKDRWAKEQQETQYQGLLREAVQSLPEMPKSAAALNLMKVQSAMPPAAPSTSKLGALLSGRIYAGPKGDAEMWLRMIQGMAAINAYPAILRAVLAAQRQQQAQDNVETNRYGGVTHKLSAQDVETIIDTAMSALLDTGNKDLARELAQVLCNPAPGVEARLAAAGNPREAGQILSNCLDQRWNRINIGAVAASAAYLPDRSMRLAVAMKILQKARERGRGETLYTLGVLLPLVETILNAEDVCSAARWIIEGEAEW